MLCPSHCIKAQLITQCLLALPLFCFFSIATDIVEERLQKAKQMGADVVVDGKKEDLKETGL